MEILLEILESTAHGRSALYIHERLTVGLAEVGGRPARERNGRREGERCSGEAS